MSKELKQRLKDNPEATLDEGIDSLRARVQRPETDRIMGLALVRGLHQAVNYAEDKRLVTEEKAEQYRETVRSLAEEGGLR
tara:strand:+ start:1849 stop:2091 length:243 start_codon:yes stop_codon:yes gene_type:complete